MIKRERKERLVQRMQKMKRMIKQNNWIRIKYLINKIIRKYGRIKLKMDNHQIGNQVKVI